MSQSSAKPEQSTFVAWTLRLSLIKRWGRMHTFIPENVSEHSHQVAAIAHLLTVIANVKYGSSLSPDKAASLAVFHENSESLLQDANSCVKYHNPAFTELYKQMEEVTETACVETLPEFLQDYYREYIIQSEVDPEYRSILKAADKLAALFKAAKEVSLGNIEFTQAHDNLSELIAQFALTMPEVGYFMDVFAEKCTVPVDELIRTDQAHADLVGLTNGPSKQRT